MPRTNTTDTYGSVARTLHWLTALLILTAIPLGLISNAMPYDTSEALAAKAELFSLHKTIGVAAFFVASLRILWALTQAHPAPLHPDRRLETIASQVVHWSLYLSLVAVPLSGWIHHAATTGFAPILWPFGQTLPFVPQSEPVASVAASLHFVFTKILVTAILLHVLGALKHQLFDRDSTLARMISGRGPVGLPATRQGRGPMLAALALYAAGTGLALALVAPTAEPAPAKLAAAASGWKVTEGTLDFTAKQLGQDVTGSFADWTAAINFDETPIDGRNGDVTVTIATDSLTLGSVTAQARTAEFFDTAAHPTASFAASIVPAETGYLAEGVLTLRGAPVPVALPFTLVVEGRTARMAGEVTLDRRAFGIGPSYPDEKTVGFPVVVSVRLTAERQD